MRDFYIIDEGAKSDFIKALKQAESEGWTLLQFTSDKFSYMALIVKEATA